MNDSEQYKLMNVKEDALSNKLKYLDVLCFPTLFPSGRFGESHPRNVPITPSEYAKSRLLNKDGRFEFAKMINMSFGKWRCVTLQLAYITY